MLPKIEPIVRHYGPLPLGQTMKIKMLYTERGSQDGIRLETFYENNEYDVTEWLARVFIDIGAALPVVVLAPAPAAPVSEQQQPGPSEIRAHTAIPEKKHRRRRKAE